MGVNQRVAAGGFGFGSAAIERLSSLLKAE
jgi:hypothetical protein